MKKLTTAICVALFALSGSLAHATDEKKAEPTKATTAKAGDKAASAAAPASASASASAPTAKKKEKKGGC